MSESSMGAGGDGGRDAIVREVDGRTIIYQLKFFPDGFDGKHRERRRQISNPAKSPQPMGGFTGARPRAPARRMDLGCTLQSDGQRVRMDRGA